MLAHGICFSAVHPNWSLRSQQLIVVELVIYRSPRLSRTHEDNMDLRKIDHEDLKLNNWTVPEKNGNMNPWSPFFRLQFIAERMQIHQDHGEGLTTWLLTAIQFKGKICCSHLTNSSYLLLPMGRNHTLESLTTESRSSKKQTNSQHKFPTQVPSTAQTKKHPGKLTFSLMSFALLSGTPAIVAMSPSLVWMSSIDHGIMVRHPGFWGYSRDHPIETGWLPSEWVDVRSEGLVL